MTLNKLNGNSSTPNNHKDGISANVSFDRSITTDTTPPLTPGSPHRVMGVHSPGNRGGSL